MARLQTSGDISLQDLISFFGGGNKLTDFYRGGGRVPTQRYQEGSTYWQTTYGPWSPDEFAPQGTPVPGSEYWRGGGANPKNIWGSQQVYDTPVGTNGWRYDYGTGDPAYIEGEYRWPIRRRWAEYELITDPGYYQDINLNVPSSGDIKLTDFYGAYDS